MADFNYWSGDVWPIGFAMKAFQELNELEKRGGQMGKTLRRIQDDAPHKVLATVNNVVKHTWEQCARSFYQELLNG